MELEFDVEGGKGKTVQRESTIFLEMHPLNVLDQRITDVVEVLDAATWEHERPRILRDTVR